MRIFIIIFCSFMLFICLVNKRINANSRGGSVQYSSPSRSYSYESFRAPVYSAPARTYAAPVFRSPPAVYVARSPPPYNPAPVPFGNVRIRDSIPSPSPGNLAPVSSGNVRSRPDVSSGGGRDRPNVNSARRPSSGQINTGSANIPSVVSRPLPPVPGFYVLHRDQANSDTGLRRRLPPYYVSSGVPAETSKASTVVERPAPQKPGDSGNRDRQVQNPRPVPIIPKPATNEKLRAPSGESKPASVSQNVARRPGPETSKEGTPFKSAKDLMQKPEGKPNMISRDSSKSTVKVDHNILLSRLKVNLPEAINEMNDLIRTRPNDAQNVVSRVSAQELAALIAAGSKNNKDKEQDNKRQRDDDKDNKRARDKDVLHTRLKDEEKNVLKKGEKKGKSEKKEEKADNIRTRPPLPVTAVTKPPGTDQTIPPCNDCDPTVTPVPPRPTIPYPRTTTPIYQQWLHYYCWNYQTPGYPYCFDYFNIGSTGAGGALRASGASCPVTQFECANAHCVYRSQLCNGRNDCKDNSDEGPLANCSAKKVGPLMDKTGKRPGNETSMLLATADQLAKLIAAGNQKTP